MSDGQAPRAPRRAAAWIAIAWLIAIVALSATATLRPQLLLQWTHYLPGRDKTGHFLLMGGFAAAAMFAFADRRLADRRVSALAVAAGVTVIVVIEEIVQLWLPNRTFSGVDLASSLSGVATFGGLAALWRMRGERDPAQDH